MHHFDITSEFIRPAKRGEPEQDWYPKMHWLLCARLDAFRTIVGRPVHVSPAPGSIGRDEPGTSRHCWRTYGHVQAVDVMPQGLKEDPERYIRAAAMVGFAGVGLYPHWSPRPGMHLDTRDTGPARWGGVKRDGRQVYVSIEEALAEFASA